MVLRKPEKVCLKQKSGGESWVELRSSHRERPFRVKISHWSLLQVINKEYEKAKLCSFLHFSNITVTKAGKGFGEREQSKHGEELRHN